ncbi:Gfo/Idh/MocA family protein [Microbacterium sp. G2-8]|uniref:Gfo/Idh/MocA family protein n=1 Tax=Microbacterium sp. G2-8 TaxID=2842454 RepID=UPI001C8953F3|nr:Gfo/Idh/MocA family oxidoreductase [Microbacterium sp. G2-8]
MIRAAIIGTGAITLTEHLPALTADPRIEIVAVCDIDGEKARAVADEHGIPSSYSSSDELLAAERPDLVAIATPPGAHRDQVIAALDAGAWVWCEKPPMLSLADYDAVAAHEGENGPYVSYIFQQRFGATADRLRRHVDEGTLGRPLVVTCDTLWYRGDDYFAAPWRAKWATEGGGPTMGHGIHQTDMVLSILGDWSEVTAAMGRLGRDTETEDVSFAIVRFANGAMMSVANSLLSPRETSSVRFDFERATVELEHLYGYTNDDWTWTPATGVTPAEAATWPAEPEDGRRAHALHLAHMLDAYERGERPRVSGADGRRSLELAAGMYKSALTGRAVSREELAPGDPFYDAMCGADPADATARIRRGTLRASLDDAR